MISCKLIRIHHNLSILFFLLCIFEVIGCKQKSSKVIQETITESPNIENPYTQKVGVLSLINITDKEQTELLNTSIQKNQNDELPNLV